MNAEVAYRRGEPNEALQLARLMAIASGGANEYALGRLVRGRSAGEVLASVVARDDSEFSYRRCVVAARNGRAVGVTNFFTHDEKEKLEPNSLAALPALARWRLIWRLRRLKAFAQLQCTDSLVVDTIAVASHWRRRGIGHGFMERVKDEARQRGLARISLQVWADNAVGRRFYAREGFRQAGAIDFRPPRPMQHEGGLLLLIADVA